MHKKRQKPKNLKAALSNLFSYCKKEAGIILFALIMAALGAVLTIAGPNQISKITDYIYNGLTGGISTEAVQEDIQKQIQSGQINIMDYLPEGTDPSSIDFQNLDLTDKNSERIHLAPRRSASAYILALSFLAMLKVVKEPKLPPSEA